MTVDFDNFVTCLVRLETMYSEWPLLHPPTHKNGFKRTDNTHLFRFLQRPSSAWTQIKTKSSASTSSRYGFDALWPKTSVRSARLALIAILSAPQWISLTMFA